MNAVATLERFKARYGQDFPYDEYKKEMSELFHKKAREGELVLKPGVRELLEYLKGKYILCVASNGPGEQQVHRLEIAGMKKYFDYIFVSERIGASKPSKVFFERAFVELNEGRKEIILPEDTVMIGDSLTSDIAGGQAFGMEVCLFRRKEGMDIPDGVRWVDRLEQIEEIY